MQPASQPQTDTVNIRPASQTANMPASHPDRYTVDQPALSQQDSQLTRQPVQSACSVCLWSVCNASAAPGTPSPARHSCQSPSSPWLTAGHPAPTCTPWCPYSSLSVSLAWSQSTPPLSFCVILSLALFLSLKFSLSPSLSLGLNLSHSLSDRSISVFQTDLWLVNSL